MTYKFSFSNSDRIIINKLNVLINKETFYDDVRKLTKNAKNDREIKSWQRLADQRYAEIITGCEDVESDIYYKDGKFHKKYFNTNGNEVFVTT